MIHMLHTWLRMWRHWGIRGRSRGLRVLLALTLRSVSDITSPYQPTGLGF